MQPVSKGKALNNAAEKKADEQIDGPRGLRRDVVRGCGMKSSRNVSVAYWMPRERSYAVNGWKE